MHQMLGEIWNIFDACTGAFKRHSVLNLYRIKMQTHRRFRTSELLDPSYRIICGGGGRLA